MILGSSLAIALVVWLATVVLCIGASGLGLTGNADLTGLVVVLAGLATFNLYYQISRGLGLIRRIAITYVGGSVLQLVLLIVLVTLTDLSATGALIIFGTSSIVAVVTCEMIAPVIRGRGVHFARRGARSLWRIGAPLIVTQAGFIVWFSADQIWVDAKLGAAQVGLYGAAKTVIQAFFVLIAGSNGVVMPRVAEFRAAGKDGRARRFIKVMVLRLSVFAVVGAAVIIAVRSPLLTVVFGSSYKAAGDALVALTVSMAVYATFVAMTMSAIGWGRPGVSGIGYTVAVAFGGRHPAGRRGLDDHVRRLGQCDLDRARPRGRGRGPPASPAALIRSVGPRGSPASAGGPDGPLGGAVDDRPDRLQGDAGIDHGVDEPALLGRVVLAVEAVHAVVERVGQPRCAHRARSSQPSRGPRLTRARTR